jgi:hypothetical protein
MEQGVGNRGQRTGRGNRECDLSLESHSRHKSKNVEPGPEGAPAPRWGTWPQWKRRSFDSAEVRFAQDDRRIASWIAGYLALRTCS